MRKMKEYCADFSSGVQEVGRIRLAVVEFAQIVGLSGSLLGDIEYAVGEALANAAEHGHDESGFISVRAFSEDGVFVVEIKDCGRGFHSWDNCERSSPPENTLRGFGIFLMRALMDEVEYSHGGSRIRLIKRMPKHSLI
jgi:anti-sigma regulatory factor (Ser/Thr protein kinase)